MLLVCKTYPTSMKNRYPGIKDEYSLKLGVCCNPNDVLVQVLAKAIVWRPAKAKSFDVYDFRFTDYYGTETYGPTNYAAYSVRYYSTAKEGRFKVVETMVIHDPNEGDRIVEVSPFYVGFCGGELPSAIYA